eukprot:4350801-Ditylum_brightwellii.AAC.1
MLLAAYLIVLAMGRIKDSIVEQDRVDNWGASVAVSRTDSISTWITDDISVLHLKGLPADSGVELAMTSAMRQNSNHCIMHKQ